ncbi:MAG: hypothetical protein GEV03_00035 [Streptosporangiales bacterium]|nr:hypothetical protein [Streptosporangiales bacterium]
MPHPTRRIADGRLGAGIKVGLALALAGAGAVSAVPADDQPAGAREPQRPQGSQRQLATARVGSDLRVTLTATRQKGGKDAAPTAVVHLDAYRVQGGRWRPAHRQRVGDQWFWYVVTGRHGVCELSIANTPDRRSVVGVSLLVSSSIGCSRTYRFPIGDR